MPMESKILLIKAHKILKGHSLFYIVISTITHCWISLQYIKAKGQLKKSQKIKSMMIYCKCPDKFAEVLLKLY